MNEKITLKLLTDCATILKQNHTTIDGVEYEVGIPSAEGYSNTIRGRIDVQEKVTEPYKSAIFAMWGDSPTVVTEE